MPTRNQRPDAGTAAMGVPSRPNPPRQQPRPHPQGPQARPPAPQQQVRPQPPQPPASQPQPPVPRPPQSQAAQPQQPQQPQAQRRRHAVPEPPAPSAPRTRSRAVVRRIGPASVLRHTVAIARRNLVQVRHDPGQLLDATLMPMVFTLIFVYVFGGAITHNQGDYKQYLLPGIMVQTISFASRVTGISLNLDFNKGVMDRLRSLPIARSAVLSGRIASDVCRMLLGQIVMLSFALIIGFRVHTGVLSAAGAVVLLLLYGIGLSWVSAFIGLSIRSAETVQSVGFLWTIPLQFGSSMFVPTETMPGWLQAFAKINPTTLVTDACRNMLIGGPVGEAATGAMAWIVGMTVIFAPLAVWRYRRRT